MNRVMIIPAAGTGSRLKADVPKVLAEVNHRPMLDYLLELYAPFVNHFALVASPEAESIIQQRASVSPVPVSIEIQETPTGMLDAILIPQQQLRGSRPSQIWITWCDQVAIRHETVQKLARESEDYPECPLVLPTIRRQQPYIHFHRDNNDVITQILHQREGDKMPATGESDMGLFALSDTAYFDLLPLYANTVEPGEQTGERNFLPFIVWLRNHGHVRTINGANYMESIGINTPEELRMIEKWLLHG